MGPVIMHHLRRYPGLTYVAQDLATLGRLLWGESAPAPDPADLRPFHLSHPLFQEEKSASSSIPGHGSSTSRRWTSRWDADPRQHRGARRRDAGRRPGARIREPSNWSAITRSRNGWMTDVQHDTDAAELYSAADYGPLTAWECPHASRPVSPTWTATVSTTSTRSPAPDADFDVGWIRSGSRPR